MHLDWDSYASFEQTRGSHLIIPSSSNPSLMSIRAQKGQDGCAESGQGLQ